MNKKIKPTEEDINNLTSQDVEESPTDLEQSTTLSQELGFDALELKKNYDANLVELENIKHQLAQEQKARKQAENDRDQLNGVISRLKVAKPETNEITFADLADKLLK